jgi:hypothetical protein
MKYLLIVIELLFNKKKFFFNIYNINMIINKINKIINKLDNFKNKYNLKKNIYLTNINPYHNDMLNNQYSNELYNYNFNYNYNYNYNLLINNNYNDIPINMLFILNYVNINNNILIIAHNINTINIILNNLKPSNKIYLLLINIKNIDSFIILKQKYNNIIDIYIIDYNINSNTYNNIINIIKNNTFSSIIYDINNNKYILPISILLNKYLINEGAYIIRHKLQYKIENNIILNFLNILYYNFYNHNFMEVYNSVTYYKDNIFTWYCFNNLKKNILSNEIKNILINYINNDIDDDFILNKYNNISNNLLKNLLIRWNIIIKSLYENYNRIDKIELYNTKYKNVEKDTNIKKNVNMNIKNIRNVSFNKIIHYELIYHKTTIKYIYKYEILPITVFDIISKYNINYNIITYEQVNNYNINSEYPDKKLLILYIQILTKISLNNNLKDYIILINGLPNYNFFIILYKLFPNFEWHIYEKNINLNLKNVNIYKRNLDINDKISFNKKIIFISDYYNDKINKINNMIEQVNIGIKLNADFIIMNYYVFETDIDLIKSFDELNIDKKYIINSKLKVNNNEFLFIKGELLLQIYTNNLILKIFIEKDNNKYNLDVYNFNDIKNKYYFYNFILKNNYTCNENIYVDYINYIPGYDNSLECLMEWSIIYNYYNKFHNITDLKKITNKLFKINFKLEKLTKKSFLMCKYDTIKNMYDTTDKSDYNKYIKLKIWKNIIKLYINISIRNQKEIILENKLDILSEKKINKSIKYLDKYYDENLNYYKLSL